MDKFIIVDGNSIINRAFYGIMGNKMLMTEDGTYTNAVYGFLSILFKIIDDIKPKYIGIAFDLKAPTKRHLKYKEYKANRKGMPDELASQLPILKEILKAMNIEVIEKEGYEADDILGTLAKWGGKQGLDVTILTGDRDSFQLIDEHITVRMPRTKMGKTETEDYNIDKIKEEYGLMPEDLIEVKGLAGDSSDNIPGVTGVGEKTALGLIKEYNTIDGVYENIENLKGKLKERLEQDKEIAYLSKELGTIDIDSDIEKDIEKIRYRGWNKEEVLNIFKRLRFNRFIQRFNLNVGVGVLDDPMNDVNSFIEDIKHEIVEDNEKIKLIKEQIEKDKIMFYYLKKESLGTDLVPARYVCVFRKIQEMLFYNKCIEVF